MKCREVGGGALSQGWELWTHISHLIGLWFQHIYVKQYIQEWRNTIFLKTVPLAPATHKIGFSQHIKGDKFWMENAVVTETRKFDVKTARVFFTRTHDVEVLKRFLSCQNLKYFSFRKGVFFSKDLSVDWHFQSYIFWHVLIRFCTNLLEYAVIIFNKNS